MAVPSYEISSCWPRAKIDNSPQKAHPSIEIVADRAAKEIDLQASDHAAPGHRRRAHECGLPPPAAPQWRISVALLRKAASCFGCSCNVNELFVITSAAAGDEDSWLEVDAAAFDIVAYAVAVLLRREPGCHPFASIDAQSISLNTLQVFVFALTPAIRISRHSLKSLSACASRARAYLSRRSSSSLSQL